MGDVALRELDRRWRSTGDTNDLASLLRHKLQAGLVTERDMRLASYCRSSAATLALGLPEPVRVDPPIDESVAVRKKVIIAKELPPAQPAVVVRPVELRETETFTVQIRLPQRDPTEIERWCHGLGALFSGPVPAVISALAPCQVAATRVRFFTDPIKAVERWLKAQNASSRTAAIMAVEESLEGLGDDEGTFWTRPATLLCVRDDAFVTPPNDGIGIAGIMLAASIEDAIFAMNAPGGGDDGLPFWQRSAAYWDSVRVRDFPGVRRKIEEWLVAWAIHGTIPSVENTGDVEGEARPVEARSVQWRA